MADNRGKPLEARYKCTIFYSYIVRKNGERVEWKGWLPAYVKAGIGTDDLNDIRDSAFAREKEGFEITSWSTDTTPTFFEV